MIGVILAAGKSTRFRDAKSKVIFKVEGKEMIKHVVDAMSPFVSKIIVVVGENVNDIKEVLKDSVEYVIDDNPKGTATSLLCVESIINEDILVSFADKPYVTQESFSKLISDDSDAVLATSFLEVITKKGRILRENNSFKDIREFKDCSESEINIKEVNTGFCKFKIKDIFRLLKKIDNDNKGGEYYLPHVFRLYVEEGLKVNTVTVDAKEGLDINTLEDLKL